MKALHLRIALNAQKSTSKCENVQSTLIAQESTTIMNGLDILDDGKITHKSREEHYLIRKYLYLSIA